MSSETTSSLWSRSVAVSKNQLLAVSIVLGIEMCVWRLASHNGGSTAFAYSTQQFATVTSEEEEQINRVRDQEISQLKIVLGRRFAERRRPDILLRLAELYIEKYRFYFLKESEIYQAQYKQGLKPKKVDHTRSRAYLKSATNSCLAILQSKVQFNKMDQVYYFLGYNHEEMEKRAEAAKYFELVVRRHPNSPYAPEAYRNLAEFAFSRNKFKDAVAYYEKAASYTKVPSYPRTLYKLAWAYFKTRRRAEALATMKKVVDLTGSDEKFVGVKEEALNDLVAFFAEAGRSKEASEYFAGIPGGPEIYVRALNRLSSAYERRGEFRTALGVNNSLISEYGSKRPDLVHEVLGRNVELYRKLNDDEGEEKALGKLVQYFLDHKSDIARGEDAEATIVRAKSYLRGRATEFHKEAQKKKKPALYSQAADLYGLYIKGFLAGASGDKERRELSEIRVYRSDSLLAANRENEAIPELEQALKSDGDAKHRRTAGTTLLSLLIKRVDAARAKGKDLAAAERQFLDAADVFERSFPDDKLVAELRYKRARLAAAKSGPEGLNSDAREALSELIEKFPNRPEAADAAHELVADAVKRKELDDATELSNKFLANPTLLKADKKGELAKYLRSVISHQSFAAAQEIEKDNDFLKAAAEYERLASASTANSEVVYKSLNNAAVNYEKAGKREEAVRVFTQLMNKFGSNAAPRSELKRLASNYLVESRFRESAALYTKLSTYSGYSPDERFSFMRTAFWLNWGLGDLGSAFLLGHRGLRELCEGGKRPYSEDRCHDLALDVAKLLIEAKRFPEATSHLKQYLSKKSASVRAAEANFILAQIYQNQLQDGRKAGTYYEEASRSVTRSKKGSSVRERNFAAHAAFILVESHFAKFNALKLELPEAKLKANTKAKLGQLESLVSRYMNVVGYGDGEWGIAALERLYDTFSGFSAELEAAPVPSQLDAAAKQQYQRGLKGVSQPMAMRAVEFLKQGYQKGLQLEVTTPTFVALTQRLAKRSAREYPPAHYAMAVSSGGSSRSVLKLAGASFDGDHDDWRKQLAAKLTQNPKSSDAWVEFGNLEALSGHYKIARLLYEQALALNPKNAAALSNLSVVLFFEQRTIEASQGLEKAAELAEFNKDIRLNLAKTLLAFHHFSRAVPHLRQLHSRFPDDQEVTEALAVGLLGSGQASQAGALLNQLDAKGSKRFSLWYNWAIWALLGGDKDAREDAIDLLKDRRDELAALEKSQVDLALGVFK